MSQPLQYKKWKLMTQFRAIMLSGLLSSLCTACIFDHSQHVPVVDGWLQAQASADEYRVKQGDTLYSIAWDFGLDYRFLAAINHLTPPYAVRPGQMLQMIQQNTSPIYRQTSPQLVRPPSRYGQQWIPAANPQQPKLITQMQLASRSQFNVPPAVAPLSSSPQPTTQNMVGPNSMPNSNSRLSSSSSGSNMRMTSTETHRYSPKSNDSNDSTRQAVLPVGEPFVSSIHWQWPAQGKILEAYSTELGGNHGLNISGVLGQAICAAAAGEVVYSGTGVRGYGNLIIIKHSSNYLSAYAYNRTLLVKLGQKVQMGQEIATMGHGDAGRIMLHFEIRFNGQPVNPVMLLR